MEQIIPDRIIKDHLTKFGVKCRIYFSKLCACVAENAGNYDPRCGKCIQGWIYKETDKEETLLVRTAMNLKMMNEQETNLYRGGANFTVPMYDLAGNAVQSHKRIMQGDIIVVDNDLRRDRDLCEIGVKDWLSAFDITEVLSVSYKDKDYVKDKDYKVELEPTESKIMWLDGGEKPARFYTVEFISAVNYLVWDDTAKLRGSQSNVLPRYVRARLRPYYEKRQIEIDKIPLYYEDKNKPTEGILRNED